MSFYDGCFLPHRAIDGFQGQQGHSYIFIWPPDCFCLTAPQSLFDRISHLTLLTVLSQHLAQILNIQSDHFPALR